MHSQIEIILYSYKNKDLQGVIDNIYNTSKLQSFSISLFDQNNIRRVDTFQTYKNLRYIYIPWDYIQSPCMIKADCLLSTNSEFSLILSDDVMLSDGWDIALLEFIKDNDVVVSGNGTAILSYKDAYTIESTRIKNNLFAISQFIDKNFIFGKTETLKRAEYPRQLKYFGENEMFSINLVNAGINIYSAPESLYQDLCYRRIENSYTIFSKYHNYNLLSEVMNSTVADKFLEFHKLEKGQLKPIPDIVNDVLYDPTKKNDFVASGKKFVRDTSGF